LVQQLQSPQKRTQTTFTRMSAKVQKLTRAVPQAAASFKGLVSVREQRRWRAQGGRDGAISTLGSVRERPPTGGPTEFSRRQCQCVGTWDTRRWV